jgi:hypothetical protein
MANEATNLMASLGVKPKEQRIQEMAGAVTRLIINDALREAKARAQVRDSNTQVQKVEKPSQNG